jgi:elongation factor Tu
MRVVDSSSTSPISSSALISSPPLPCVRFIPSSSVVVRELLSQYNYNGDETKVIRGSALAAATGGDEKLGKQAIIALMEAVEEAIPTPVREVDKPFLMPVEDVFSIQGRGTVATGRIETGSIKTGDEIELVGGGPSQKTACTGMTRVCWGG